MEPSAPQFLWVDVNTHDFDRACAHCGGPVLIRVPCPGDWTREQAAEALARYEVSCPRCARERHGATLTRHAPGRSR